MDKVAKKTEEGLAKANRETAGFEVSLLRAGALQKAIFNSANFSSIATDEKGVIQIFNVGAERMLGYAAVDVVNKITPADISDPQEVIARANTLSRELETKITPGFEALVFKASRGIEDIYELTYIRKDGSRFPAVVSVTALRDAEDGIIGYLLIGTDNTARKQAEDALLKAGALQKAIFNSAKFSSIATDEKGVIQIFNVGAERMLGYAAVDVVNKITPADISDPQEVIARANTLSRELETKITPGFEALVFKASRGIEDIYELTYIRKDGSRFPAVVSVTPLRDAQDGIIGYLLIGTDNTTRKQVEADREAAERMAKLKAVNKDLEEFAYVASHDLKAPLRVIDNASKWLEEDLQEHLTGEIAENLNLVRGRVKRMDKLLDDLLEYARIGRNTDVRYTENINGAVLMADALELVGHKDFTVRVSPNFADIQLCRMPLQQILMNLVSNAIKHHDKKTGCIDVTVEDEGQEYTFAVKDDGPGIAAQFHDQVFKMFQTLRPRDQVEGSGMGLAMVRKHVEFFGGVIRLESTEGQGSIFRFTWPKHQYLGRQVA